MMSRLTPSISEVVQANKSALSINVWLTSLVSSDFKEVPCVLYILCHVGLMGEGPRLVRCGLRPIEG